MQFAPGFPEAPEHHDPTVTIQRLTAELEESRQALARAARLQEVTAALSAAVSLERVAEVILTQGLATLGAVRGAVALLAEGGGRLDLVGALGYYPSAKGRPKVPLDRRLPLPEAVLDGKPRFLEHAEGDLDRYPGLAVALADSPTRAIAALPLRLDSRVIGGLGLSFEEPHPFVDGERDFMLSLAHQCAQALERARLFEAVRRLNANLERRVAVRTRALERAALADPMTGLGNRRALVADFERYAAGARRRVAPLLLSIWDVNGLKRVNDAEGHAAGDAYLLAFVASLRASARREDGLYRTGGDEFVGLHPEAESGAVIYERVLTAFPWVCAGWVEVEGITLDEALRMADTRLYEEKARVRAGREP